MTDEKIRHRVSLRLILGFLGCLALVWLRTAPSIAQQSKSYEPPINIVTVLHIDPEPMNRGETEFKIDRDMYEVAKGEILFLMEQARKRGFKIDALFNGFYMQAVLEYNDFDHIKQFLAEGHNIGTHVHPIIYNEKREMWENIPREGGVSEEAWHEAWSDATRYINAVLEKVGAKGQNKIHCNGAAGPEQAAKLNEEFGFLYPTGGGAVQGPEGPILGEQGIHEVWNPMRVGKYVHVSYMPQVGNPSAHGIDLHLPQIQRRFIYLLEEWSHRESTEADDNIWEWGYVIHPNYGTGYNDDIIALYDWLDQNFINKKTAKGNTVAVYASVPEVAAKFEEWEKTHPDGGLKSRYDAYPYTYEKFVRTLDGAEYKKALDIPEVRGFKFMLRNRSMYLIWSQKGERKIDLSKELSGDIYVTNAKGETSSQPSSALPISEEPMLVTQYQDLPRATPRSDTKAPQKSKAPQKTRA